MIGYMSVKVSSINLSTSSGLGKSGCGFECNPTKVRAPVLSSDRSARTFLRRGGGDDCGQPTPEFRCHCSFGGGIKFVPRRDMFEVRGCVRVISDQHSPQVDVGIAVILDIEVNLNVCPGIAIGPRVIRRRSVPSCTICAVATASRSRRRGDWIPVTSGR